jgi:hypothetical protein
MYVCMYLLCLKSRYCLYGMHAPVSTHQPALGPHGGSCPFSLNAIHKEGLCPSSGDINRLILYGVRDWKKEYHLSLSSMDVLKGNLRIHLTWTAMRQRWAYLSRLSRYIVSYVIRYNVSYLRHMSKSKAFTRCELR